MELKQTLSHLCCAVFLILLALESHVHADDANSTATTDGNVTHNPHDVHSHPHVHTTTISPTGEGTDQGVMIDWTSTEVIIGIVGAAIGVLGLVIAIVCAVRAGKAQSKVRRMQSKGPEYRELNQMPSA
ncbi:Hypp1302 [Branchiostoma lanceolatum]|uniref:Hypp1302 protein n=1 Tax=Branchiostoma lanceolatum TaxID=7740 RepID=A0A8J9ZGG3_BRALA|nr:Hypp1302 [Branchiostoma lanceolatum]